MLAEFSFLRHPLEKVIRFGKYMVPGLERMDVIYFDENTKTLIARTMTKEMDSPYGKLMEIKDIRPAIDKLRRRKFKFEWADKHDLPWNPPSYENINKGLLHEMEKFVLIIPVESAEKGQVNDLVLFYFNNNLSNLMMTSSLVVSITEKDLLGAAYKATVSAMIRAAREDREVWEDFAPAFRNNTQTIENLRIELEQMRNMYRERLEASCRYYLSNLSEVYGRNYEFTPDALELIRKYEGEYFRLENAIKAGVRIANNLHIGNSKEVIEIRESYLNFNTTKRIEEIHDAHLQTELEKPFNYLNQLEEICEDLQKHNRPTTGKNVAEKMNPPVKAPSITMYLNSNQEKILRLFSFYSSKWKILRTGFKPTFNLLENARNRPHQV